MTSSADTALPTRAAISTQRRMWSRRVGSWEHHGAVDLAPVVEAVLERTPTGSGQRVVDIGSGTGTLALPLAESGAEVVAVDVSMPMLEALTAEADSRRLQNLETLNVAAEQLDLEPQSVDAIVSNYTLHHLRDEDKSRLVTACLRWLRPGGRLVIGDMMFGRGATSHDREIIRSKVVALARKGPGGWWRLVKNAFRFLLRLQERPLRMGSWVEILSDAGFEDVSGTVVLNEAAVVVGVAPGQADDAHPAASSTPDGARA